MSTFVVVVIMRFHEDQMSRDWRTNPHWAGSDDCHSLGDIYDRILHVALSGIRHYPFMVIDRASCTSATMRRAPVDTGGDPGQAPLALGGR